MAPTDVHADDGENRTDDGEDRADGGENRADGERLAADESRADGEAEPDAADATNWSDDEDVERALAALRAGEPICVHDFDDREGETDLLYPAGAVDADAVARLRNDAGGLVCVALADAVAEAADLPLLADSIDHPAVETTDLAYGDRSSFSLTVNHRDTFTGVTDADRALTISELGSYADAVAAGDVGDQTAEFAGAFRVPGHVHLLRAAPGGVDERQGHTELAVALARAAGVAPAVVVCEMLDDATGEALSVAAAREYARRHGVPFVEGERVLAALG